MAKSTKFIIAIAFQLAVIGGLLVYHLLILANGTTIGLRIQPIDPRDPLRGDFMTFRYDVSSVSSYYGNSEKFSRGDTVYVTLYESGGYYLVKSISKIKPSNNGDIFLKGKISSGAPDSLNEPSKVNLLGYNDFNSSGTMQIEYGIEQYFIPEGKGSMTTGWGNKEAKAKVVVDNDGNAVLKGIYVDGKEWP